METENLNTTRFEQSQKNISPRSITVYSSKNVKTIYQSFLTTTLVYKIQQVQITFPPSVALPLASKYLKIRIKR